nr:hypothetical protein [Tanacetum cinerariifolium]
QTSGSGNTFLLAVAFFFKQWEVPSGSGNFLTSRWNALCILFPTASGSFSIIGGGIKGLSYEIPLRVVMALASFLGFGMVVSFDLTNLDDGFLERSFQLQPFETAEYCHEKWGIQFHHVSKDNDYNYDLLHIFFFFSSIAVQTSGSGISNLLAVGITFTGSGNLYCQWELYPGSGNALCILFLTRKLTDSSVISCSDSLGNVPEEERRFFLPFVEDFVYQVEHKDAKKINEMYYPRNSKAYKEYYAVTSGAAPPKTKASVRKTKSSFDTTITPLTTAGIRLSTSTKGKQPAKASKAKSLTVLSEVAMTETKH